MTGEAPHGWVARLRAGLRASARRVSDGRWPIVETTVAAGAAWLIAHELLGQEVPFFAPAAALIVLGQARGQRLSRALEVTFGVAGGVLIADLIAHWLGEGNTITVIVIVFVTMTATVAVGGGTVLMVQATVSALYVAVIAPPSVEGWVPVRFIDALIGGAVALVVTWVTSRGDPMQPLTDDLRRVLTDAAAVVTGTADALAAHDEARAREVLQRARQLDATVSTLRSTVPATREALWLDPHRQVRLTRVFSIEESLSQLDYLVRDVRVLARAGVGTTRRPTPAPPEVAEALRMLALAITTAEQSWVAELAGSAASARWHAEEAEQHALAAVGHAGTLLTSTHLPEAAPLPVVMVVGQVRACAIDLLRAVGVEDLTSLDRVDAALGMAPD